MTTIAPARTAVSPWMGFGFVMVGTVLGTVVLSLPNASLTQIESDIGLSGTTSELSWTLAFTAVSAVLVPAGQLSDRIGRVWAFLIGSIALAAFCLLGGMAWGATTFLLFRLLQGAATASIFAPATGIVNALFTDARRRGIAFAVSGLASGLGLGLGQSSARSSSTCSVGDGASSSARLRWC